MNWSFLLLTCLTCLIQANENEPPECSRYGPEEFVASVFKPFMNKELDWLKDTYYLTLNGVIDLLEGIKNRRSQASAYDFDALEAGIQSLQETGEILFGPRLLQELEQKLEELYEFHHSKDDLDDNTARMSKLHMYMMRVLQAIHGIHRTVDGPFEALANTAKEILQPVVHLLKLFLNQEGASEEKRQELVDKLKEKNNMLGIVVGHVAKHIVENRTMDQPSFLFRTDYMWGDLMIRHRNLSLAAETSYDDFWPTVLEEFWSYDEAKFCHESLTMEECWELDRQNTLSMLFYHTEWEDDRRMPEL